MLTPSDVKTLSSTSTVKDLDDIRLQQLIDEAQTRIELWLSLPLDQNDKVLYLAHWRLVEALALTDNEEILGADARGIVAETDKDYSYQREQGKLTTGSSLVDNLLTQWTLSKNSSSQSGSIKVRIL